MTAVPYLVNFTPRAVRVLTAKGVLCELPAAPVPARCREVREDVGHLVLGPQQTAVPLVRIGYGEGSDLPAPRPGTWHVVSRFVADALPHSDLLVPHDVVRDASGQITGCRSLVINSAHRSKDGS